MAKKAKKEKSEKSKTKFSQQLFDKLSHSLSCKFGDQSMEAEKRDKENPFSSGSQGYNVSGKVTIGGVKFQVSCNLIAVGSKPE